MWVGAFTLATALSAQVRIPIPFTPVPVTLQTFFVLLAGVVLGPRWGALSQGLYIALGASGLPVFIGGGAGLSHLSGITAGYLLAFPVAAYLAGLLCGRELRRIRVWGALLISGLLIIAAGTGWLALLNGTGLREASLIGFWPFVAGDLIKTAAAAELGLRIGRRD
jgi:biotin transport system substrate-specific component